MLFKNLALKVALLLAIQYTTARPGLLKYDFNPENFVHKAFDIESVAAHTLLQAETDKGLQGTTEYEAQTRPKANKEQEIDADTKINLLIWAFVVVFVISKVFLMRSIWLKSKLNKVKLKAVEAEAALLTEQQEKERQKVESQKVMIEEKEREMVAIALKLTNYNDKLQDIVALIEQKKITTATEVKSEINRVIAQDDFWNYFDLRFTQLHPDFKARLSDQYAELSKSEIDFCCLLRLNLSNKEIGSLLSISYESVISKRYRIRKKMELNEEDDLNGLLEKV